MKIINEIENVYKKYVFCCKEDVLTSHEPLLGNVTLPTPILAWVAGKFICIIILRK